MRDILRYASGALISAFGFFLAFTGMCAGMLAGLGFLVSLGAGQLLAAVGLAALSTIGWLVAGAGFKVGDIGIERL